MQRTRCHWMLTTALLALTAHAAAAPQGEYYGSGYTIISQAHGNDDLQATVYRQLTPGTVGQALPQLLDGTGWRLADRYAADDRIYRLYDQPLPEHKLRIGPMPLDQALTWIAGEGWALVVDPVNRLVSFEVEARYDARPPRSTLRSPAPARVTDNVDTTTPVYADLPPQGTFPAVQTAPVSPAATYGASAYPLTVSSPPPASTESWQSALPQRLAASAQAPRARRSAETRQAVRPATAEAKPATKTRVAAATATSRRHDKTSAKSSDSATTTKTLPAQTAGRTQPAAGQTPGKAVPAASLPTAKKTSTVVQDTKAVTSQAAHQADRKPPAPEKTPDPSAASAVKKAEAHREKSAPAPDKTTTAPVKTESAAPVLANPDQAAAATGNNHTAAKPAAASAKAVKTVTAPHAAPADKSITVVGPPPALIAKRTIHTPPQRPTPDTATPPAKAAADAAPAPQSQEAP
ncbi:hypothetical protein [Cardiobacterium hominis]|uniref:hypothetical protein n=1 Tax=Cardiobacterium hominis TaxID=2718 RepID=UPI0028D2B8EB|nr:hypothetical protein [Cardiobacterium hominis]